MNWGGGESTAERRRRRFFVFADSLLRCSLVHVTSSDVDALECGSWACFGEQMTARSRTSSKHPRFRLMKAIRSGICVSRKPAANQVDAYPSIVNA